jgi:hypothetical protein
MVSKKLRAKVKLCRRRQYEIARAAGIHPTTLSRILNNAEPIKYSDPRVVAVGRLFGLSVAECFESLGEDGSHG